MFEPGGPTLIDLAKQALSDTKTGYDLLAPKFDKTSFLTPRGVLNTFTYHLLKRQRPLKSALDLFTGTGAAIEALLLTIEERIVGVDWSQPMLDEARKKLEVYVDTRWDGPRISLVRKDVFNLKYENEFDLVTCFGALGHIERSRQKRFVDLVYRMLKPGGTFAFDALKIQNIFSQFFWTLPAFDLAIGVRNILLRPRFAMYYSDYTLSVIINLFDKKRWRLELIHFDELPKKPKFAIVMAKKI